MAKTYDTYKDSGIAWIGNIPSEWKTCRIKDTSLLYTGNSIKDEEKDFFQDMNEARPYIATKDIDATYMSANYNNGLYIKHTDCNFRIAPPSSTLMCIEGGSAGRKKAFIDREVSFVNKLCCFAPFEGVYGKYIYYFLCSPNFEDIFNSKITGLIGGVNIPTLKNIECLLPSISEQEAIATYLDEKCGEIDSLISLQEEMISELQAYKQSVITEAVIKGLDPNVPMKDSGVEWIGEIPNGWKIMPIRSLFDKRNQKNNPIISKERLSLSIGVGITKYADKTTNLDRFKDDFTAYQLAYKDDIVLNSMNMIVGAVGKSDFMGCVSPVYYVVTAKQNVSPDFYAYSLNTPKIRDVYHSLGRGIYAIERGGGRVNTCRLKVPYYDFSIINMPVPPLSEQQAIASYLDEKISQIDALIALKQEKITELKDYKKSIIYEYVTGKKKV